MCAVIGVYMKGFIDIELVKRVFRESEIRGMHATGVTYFKQGKLHTIKEAIPASEFVEKYRFEDMMDGDSLKLIGHCRYSTSDLEFNQPMESDTLSVVHNGVITQTSPETWKETFGYDVSTKNDSELLMHSLEEGKNPGEAWPGSSVAYVSLDSEGVMRAYRNGKRPLYSAIAYCGAAVVTSTSDIAMRAGVVTWIRKIACGETYTYTDQGLSMSMEGLETEDLQWTHT